MDRRRMLLLCGAAVLSVAGCTGEDDDGESGTDSVDETDIELTTASTDDIADASNAGETAVPPVEPVDLIDLDPATFEDDEVDLPYYLANFHEVANAIVTTGNDAGFIDRHVWRLEADQEPYNARVMENILSLAWFYTTNRPWNPYFGDRKLRQRLELTLSFWTDMQAGDGRFSEYGRYNWNLAATAFATKFIGEALVRLDQSVVAVDEELYDEALDALRAAIMVTLTDDAFREDGASFANQFSNVWGGAGAYLSIRDDEEVHAALEAALADADRMLSTAGFYYEADGPDFGYGWGTEQSNQQAAWHYLGNVDESLQAAFVAHTQPFWEWLSYAAVVEPDGTAWFHPGGVAARTDWTSSRAAFGVGNPLAESIETVRAFHYIDRERHDWLDHHWSMRQNRWPAVERLGYGVSTFSPYAFLHRDHERTSVQAVDRRAAREALPYIDQETFTHQRVDDRVGTAFTFVRRPSYYAILSAGPLANDGQSNGLHLLWHPQVGTWWQTAREGPRTGTTTEGTTLETAADEVSYEIAGESVAATPGVEELPDGPLTVTYRNEAGHKEIRFDEKITVDVAVEGGFTELIPLLLRERDSVSIDHDDDRFTLDLERNDVRVSITATGVNAHESTTDTFHVGRAGGDNHLFGTTTAFDDVTNEERERLYGVGWPRRVRQLVFDARDSLSYTVSAHTTDP